MEKRALRQLKRAYKTRLKVLNNKKFLGDLGASILVFVEQLKYLRDTLILNTTPAESSQGTPIEPFLEFAEQSELIEKTTECDEDTLTALIIAIAEFERTSTKPSFKPCGMRLTISLSIR